MSITLFNNSSEVERVAAGEILFRQGDPATHMYVVVGGRIEVEVDGRVIDAVEGGGVLGEMALIDGSPRSATARVASDAVVVPIDKARFTRLVGQTPFFALQVMGIMAGRLRRRMASDGAAPG